MTKDPATVLEEAADLLLIHGRCKIARELPDGSLCVLGAIQKAANCEAFGSQVYDHRHPAHAAASAVRDRVQVHVGLWNDMTRDDDEVRDTLLLAAKDLRNEALSS